MKTLILSTLLSTVPADFTESNALDAASISGQPVTICTTEQKVLARQFNDSCRGSTNSIDYDYCAVIDFNRFCEPTTHARASEAGALMSRLRSLGVTYYNTYQFTSKEDNTEYAPAQYAEYLCTPEQKISLTTEYSKCFASGKGSRECMTNVQNIKSLLCEAPRVKRSKSQQVITEISSKTIEER